MSDGIVAKLERRASNPKQPWASLNIRKRNPGHPSAKPYDKLNNPEESTPSSESEGIVSKCTERSEYFRTGLACMEPCTSCVSSGTSFGTENCTNTPSLQRRVSFAGLPTVASQAALEPFQIRLETVALAFASCVSSYSTVYIILRNYSKMG